MRRFLRIVGTAVALTAAPVVLGAQTVVPQTLAARLAGEWTGTLRLDNSSPQLALQFTRADSALSGTVFADGTPMGAMENLSTRGDTVHFKVGVFDFTGVVSGTRMQVALIVYNGTTKAVTLVKTPPLAPPPELLPSPSSTARQMPVRFDVYTGEANAAW